MTHLQQRGVTHCTVSCWLGTITLFILNKITVTLSRVCLSIYLPGERHESEVHNEIQDLQGLCSLSRSRERTGEKRMQGCRRRGIRRYAKVNVTLMDSKDSDFRSGRERERESEYRKQTDSSPLFQPLDQKSTAWRGS